MGYMFIAPASVVTLKCYAGLFSLFLLATNLPDTFPIIYLIAILLMTYSLTSPTDVYLFIKINDKIIWLAKLAIIFLLTLSYFEPFACLIASTLFYELHKNISKQKLPLRRYKWNWCSCDAMIGRSI